jgi:hypothetical protein
MIGEWFVLAEEQRTSHDYHRQRYRNTGSGHLSCIIISAYCSTQPERFVRSGHPLIFH